jgi:hypothetical protein
MTAEDRAIDTGTRPAVTGRPRRPHGIWRGLCFTSVAIGAVLMTGLASATLSASSSGTGSAPARSSAVSISTPATHVCTYPSLVPGDLTGSANCSMPVTYTGSIPAYMSLTVALQSKSGLGGIPLYDGTNTTGLILAISDGHNHFTVPTGPGTTGGSCPSGSTCWTAANDLAAQYDNGTTNLTFKKGDSVTFTVTPRLPKTVGNRYQGGKATMTLVVQAVQAAANPLPSRCTVSTIGQPCHAAGDFSWS